MSTISVPLSDDQLTRLEWLVANGIGENKAAVMRRALDKLAEEEAVNDVLAAAAEPNLAGDARDLMQKLAK